MENNNNKEDLAAPESWETADLEESVKRLLLSKTSSDELEPVQNPVQQKNTVQAVQSTEELIIQVDQFLREALEKPRERISVLRMEQDIEKFIRNPTQIQIEFNSLPTSYLRLAAHRLAQHYFLQSIAIPDPLSPDGSGSQILIRKTSSTIRLPAIRLADIPVNLPQDASSSAPVKLAIKPRPHRGQHGNSSSGFGNGRANLQKSVEERKEEYNRARNRIFNNNNNNNNNDFNDNNSNGNASDDSTGRGREEVKLPESLDNWMENNTDDLNVELGGNSSGNRNKEGGIVRTRSGGNRVAIFRDREVDRKDPDYDRSYDRYAQRFDPGFGFNNGSVPMQPLYAPAVTYHTEFPQLGSSPMPPPPLSLDPQLQVRGVSPHMHGGPWAAPQQMAMAYRPGPAPPEAMMAHAFNVTSPMGGGAGGPGLRSPVYMSPPYPMHLRPAGMQVPFVPSHERMIHQYFVQKQQEGSYGVARPR